MAKALKRLLGDDCVEELHEASPANRGIKKVAKVDCDAEIDTVAKYASLIRSWLPEQVWRACGDSRPRQVPDFACLWRCGAWFAIVGHPASNAWRTSS
jgi:hypothetical protein